VSQIWISSPLFDVQPSSSRRLLLDQDIPQTGWRGNLKSVVDRALAVILLILLAPVLLSVAAAIRITGPGPVLFRQTRLGRYGRPFTLLKFRTVVDGTFEGSYRDETETLGHLGWGVPLGLLRSGAHLTGVGLWLRRTGLDELPQLLNVARGQMSLVGPRPRLMNEIEAWSDDDLRILLIRPGITGLAQLRPDYATGDGKPSALDEFYFERWSPALDAMILARTAARTGRDINTSRLA
jgi:lipopolysaccharide/colanic/teichoic acid biosynthesis glycosyltransferase